MMLKSKDVFVLVLFALELLLVENMVLWRTDRKKHFILRGALVLLDLFGVCVITLLIAPYDNTAAPQVGSAVFRFLLVFFSSLGNLMILYKCSFVWTLCAGVIGYAVQHLGYVISEIVLLSSSELSGRISFGSNQKFLQSQIISAVVFMVVAIVCYYLFIKSIVEAKCMLQMKQIAYLGAGIGIIAVILSNLCYNFDIYTLLLYRMLCGYCCFMILFLFQFQVKNLELQNELSAIQQQNKLQTNYYEMLKENIEVTNRKCHDVKHQLMAVYNHERNAATEEIIKNVEESINIYDSIAKTGNVALDTVLAGKGLLCQKEKIKFTYIVDGEALKFVKPKDIYVLFGNALDNAIEAVQQIGEAQKRIIHLKAVCKKPFIYIHLENYYNGIIRFQDGELVTTKVSNSGEHGYGVKSMKMLVEKYSGEIQITAEEDLFQLNILIPLLEE